MQADGKFRLTLLLERALVQLDKGCEALGAPGDDREHQRQAEARSAHDGLRAAADADPGGDVPRADRRAHELVRERGAEGSRPGDRLLTQQPHQQVEFLLEQLLVVGEVEAEERKGLGRRAAADDQLRAAVRDGVEGGVLGVQAHRVLRAENRDRSAEPDPFRPACDRREDDVAR